MKKMPLLTASVASPETPAGRASGARSVRTQLAGEASDREAGLPSPLKTQGEARRHMVGVVNLSSGHSRSAMEAVARVASGSWVERGGYRAGGLLRVKAYLSG